MIGRQGILRRFGIAVLALLAAIPIAPAEGQPRLAFADGVLSGDVTDAAAVIWSRLPDPAGAALRLEYGTSPALGHWEQIEPPAPDADGTLTVELAGLQPATRYAYRVAAYDRAGRLLGASLVGAFRTAPAPGAAAPLTLAWSADLSQRFKPYRIFEPMRAAHPDLFLFLGDTVYADLDANARTLPEYRAIHRRNRDDDAFHRLARAVPIVAVWDDHEVASNFDRTHPRLAAGLQAFLEHWPIRRDPAAPGRLYRSFRWGREVEVFVLDTRQYRTPSREPDRGGKTMLGAVQKAWLVRGLADSQAAFKIIASSVPLRYHGPDSWDGYARERAELLAFIRSRGIRGVVLLTADVHYAAVLRHPESVVEAVAGPLAAFINRRRPAAGAPGVEFSFNRDFTFGLVRADGGVLTIELHDSAGRRLHSTLVSP